MTFSNGIWGDVLGKFLPENVNSFNTGAQLADHADRGQE